MWLKFRLSSFGWKPQVSVPHGNKWVQFIFVCLCRYPVQRGVSSETERGAFHSLQRKTSDIWMHHERKHRGCCCQSRCMLCRIQSHAIYISAGLYQRFSLHKLLKGVLRKEIVNLPWAMCSYRQVQTCKRSKILQSKEDSLNSSFKAGFPSLNFYHHQCANYNFH